VWERAPRKAWIANVRTAASAVKRSSGFLYLVPRLKTCYVKHVKQMLGIRLEPELEEKLESLAKETGRSKSYYAREAIRQYLEDREDYLKGIAALERREPTITLEELERRLGLAD
jgi:RHH-type transcriptional regulator, rel operon repressor / antitoxin RelB